MLGHTYTFPCPGLLPRGGGTPCEGTASLWSTLLAMEAPGPGSLGPAPPPALPGVATQEGRATRQTQAFPSWLPQPRARWLSPRFLLTLASSVMGDGADICFPSANSFVFLGGSEPGWGSGVLLTGCSSTPEPPRMFSESCLGPEARIQGSHPRIPPPYPVFLF